MQVARVTALADKCLTARISPHHAPSHTLERQEAKSFLKNDSRKVTIFTQISNERNRSGE
jgi:hypothetical protein